jgi:hypothetical protein
VAIPAWFKPWLRWKIIGGVRPPGAPERIPDWAWKAHAWFVPWGRWYVNGKPAGSRPQAPSRIPAWAHGVLGLPAVTEAFRQLGLPPPPSTVKIPNLGPVVADGQSLLDYDLTHATGGLPGYPAFDAGWKANKAIVAPEALAITRHSSARRRDGNANGKAFYATGASGIDYWFGHVEQIPALGKTVTKGTRIAVISSNHEEPHLHLGVDASKLIGRELDHHTNYTHGAPTIRTQFERWL